MGPWHACAIALGAGVRCGTTVRGERTGVVWVRSSGGGKWAAGVVMDANDAVDHAPRWWIMHGDGMEIAAACMQLANAGRQRPCTASAASAPPFNVQGPVGAARHPGRYLAPCGPRTTVHLQVVAFPAAPNQHTHVKRSLNCGHTMGGFHAPRQGARGKLDLVLFDRRRTKSALACTHLCPGVACTPLLILLLHLLR